MLNEGIWIRWEQDLNCWNGRYPETKRRYSDAKGRHSDTLGKGYPDAGKGIQILLKAIRIHEKGIWILCNWISRTTNSILDFKNSEQ